jgi:glucose/arabinose dehydrogenase
MRITWVVVAGVALFGCPHNGGNDGGSGGGASNGGGAGGMGGSGGAGGGFNVHTVPPDPDGGWCSQAGAWVHDGDGGYHQVTGSTDPSSDLQWLTMPPGFCAHFFGHVPNVREIRFAPGGELFVASPTQGTTSGGQGGLNAIVLLPDDNNDGVAEAMQMWRGNLPATQGMLFSDGAFYFQNGTVIMKEQYQTGDRAPTGAASQVADVQIYQSSLHWPKTLDVAEDGTVYVTNGGDQGETCDTSRPFHGGILALDPSGTNGLREIAKGLRNPIYLRCHHDGHDLCFANELARDYSADIEGREKLIPVENGDDWGFPCCASLNLPYTDVCLPCGSDTATSADSDPTCTTASQCSPVCSTTTPESASFIIGDTPFGLDFIDTQFPSPWDHQVIVATHGAAGSWVGARVVAIAYDTSTGKPFPGTNLPGQDAGSMQNFLQGWDDGHNDHGRPGDVTVSPDGRLFVANDTTGDIIWISPITP